MTQPFNLIQIFPLLQLILVTFDPTLPYNNLLLLTNYEFYTVKYSDRTFTYKPSETRSVPKS